MEDIELNQQVIGRAVKVQLAKNDMTVVDLAERMGVSRMSGNNYRAGKVRNIITIWRMAKIFGVTLDEFFDIKK